MTARAIAVSLAVAGSRRRIAASFPRRSEGRAAFVARAWIILWRVRDLRRFGGAA